MKIKSLFDDCKSIFDIVSILNTKAQEGKVKLFYAPRMDGLELPVTEPLMVNEIIEINSVQVSDLWKKDDVLQEVLFTDKRDGKNWTATFGTNLEGYEDDILSNGVRFIYVYDADCLDSKLNYDYVVQTRGETLVLKADIFVMVTD